MKPRKLNFLRQSFRRLICTVLCLMLTCLSVGAFANDTSGLETAIATVRTRIDIPEEYSNFTSNVRTASSVDTYELYWLSDDGYSDYVSVWINQYGDIVDYRSQKDYDYSHLSSARFPSYEEDEVIQIAHDFLVKLNPNICEQFPIEYAECPDIGIRDSMATVYFPRYVNGIMFSGDNILVTFNLTSGAIAGLNSTFAYCDEIPMPDNVISVSDAEEIFTALSPMKAAYFAADGKTAKLMYYLSDPYLKIDALSGEEYIKEDYEASFDDAENATMTASGSSASDSAESYRFTEEELSNISEIGGLMSEDELKAAAETMSETDIGKYTYSSIQYTKESPRWYYLLENDEGEEEDEYLATLWYYDDELGSATVTLDAKTGELSRLSSSRYNDTDTAAVTEAQALEIAKAFAEKYATDEYALVNTDIEVSSELPSDNSYTTRYYFTFNRMENGYEYSGNRLTVSVYASDGAVAAFSKVWYDGIEFESSDDIISPDEASAAIMSNTELELVYTPYKNEAGGQSAALVYTLSDYSVPFISAKTGDPINYDGTPYAEESPKGTASDISGHYAEEQIAALIKYGVIEISDNENAYRPDDAITQGEMLELISAVIGKTYKYPKDAETMYSYMRSCGIIEAGEEAPDEAIMRELGAKLVVRSLGYGEIAALSGIYTTGFADETDISSTGIGYVAIAKGLGIVGGSPGGVFEPQNMLTRADAAIMIYNCLSR